MSKSEGKRKGNNIKLLGLFKYIAKMVKNEFTTVPGRINLLTIIVMGAVLATVFAANALERVAIALFSIWNPGLTQYLSDSTSLVAFIILAVIACICICFVSWHASQIAKQDDEGKQ